MAEAAHDAARDARPGRRWRTLVRRGVFACLVVAVGACAAVWTRPSRGGQPDSTSLQSQVLAVASELRAPGDHNTMTVATSSLPQAQHMRYEIQQDLLAGRTPAEVKRLMVREYGDEVLAAPPVRGWGGVVWVLPWLVAGVILAGSARYVRRHAQRRAMEGARRAAGRVPVSEPGTAAFPSDERGAVEAGLDPADVLAALRRRLRDYL